MRVHARFRLPAGEVITGRFTGDEVFANMTGRPSGPAVQARRGDQTVSNEQMALAQPGGD